MPLLCTEYIGGIGQKLGRGGRSGCDVHRSVTLKMTPYLRILWPDHQPAGNNYGIGEARKAELQGSCKALGIDEARCVALDRPEIQDNPKVWWDQVVIESIVREYVEKWHVDAVSCGSCFFFCHSALHKVD